MSCSELSIRSTGRTYPTHQFREQLYNLAIEAAEFVSLPKAKVNFVESIEPRATVGEAIVGTQCQPATDGVID